MRREMRDAEAVTQEMREELMELLDHKLTVLMKSTFWDVILWSNPTHLDSDRFFNVIESARGGCVRRPGSCWLWLSSPSLSSSS